MTEAGLWGFAAELKSLQIPRVAAAHDTIGGDRRRIFIEYK